MISLINLYKTYKGREYDVDALKDINITISDGEIFGIIGLSGAGKSTLVRCINLLERPTSGSVVIDNEDLTLLNKKQLNEIRKNIGMIFQSFNLFEQRTVLENVLFPLKLIKTPKDKALEIARHYLELVGLSNKEKSYPSMLSGGEKQRVAIARALTTNPKYLLCDEPTSALDPENTNSILGLLKEINNKLKVTIIVITHEMKVIEKICDRVAIIDKSSIGEIGKVSDIFTNPQTSVGKKLVLPESSKIDFSKGKGKKIRLIFDGTNTHEAILSKMILECNAPVNILYADTKEFEGITYGHVVLELPDDKVLSTKILAWLKNHNQLYEEEL